VAVLEDDDEWRSIRAPAEARDEEILERRLAQLRVEASRQLGVADRDADDLAQERSAGDEGRVDRCELLLDHRDLPLARVLVREVEHAPPDLSPDEIGRLRTVGLAFPEGDGVASAARVPGELGDEPGL